MGVQLGGGGGGRRRLRALGRAGRPLSRRQRPAGEARPRVPRPAPPTRRGIPPRSFGEGSALAWLFIVTRFAGSVFVVPPLEEVFYRSFLYRYVAARDWAGFPLGRFAAMPFLVTALVFGFAHFEWLPGILCACVYQGLVCWKGRLGDALTAHAITNALLAVLGRVEGRVALLVTPSPLSPPTHDPTLTLTRCPCVRSPVSMSKRRIMSRSGTVRVRAGAGGHDKRASTTPPCVLFEDDHLLVVHKPAGWNTHAPDPHAGEGIYDWLRHREPRWATLAIVHRLDKETSGVLVFGKTPEANRSLTQQFTANAASTSVTSCSPTARRRDPEFTARSKIARAGDHYASSPNGEPAETRFRVIGRTTAPCFRYAPARSRAAHGAHAPDPRPRGGAGRCRSSATGSTAARLAARVCLHAASPGVRAPGGWAHGYVSRRPPTSTPIPRRHLRAAFIESARTDAFRLVHGCRRWLAGLAR